MDLSTVVILGAGQAGAWAARTLRQEGFNGRLLLIGDEAHPPYERPPLSKAILAGQATPESLHILGPTALAQMHVEWFPGIRAIEIDRAGRRVVLADGRAVGYDKLILCTGGRARELGVPGSDLSGVHKLRTIDDALRLAPLLQFGAHVAVIGGGWIGLEVAATARKRGATITMIEPAQRLCQRSVPEALSSQLLALHRVQGVEIRLGTAVIGLAPADGGRLDVMLSDGTAIRCDVAVVGIGLVPNDELARAAGIDCEDGVLVDAQCRTSDPHIFAAGDVAVACNSWAGRRIRLESWQNAQEQGIAAAMSALGRSVRYDPLPWFWSDQHGTNLQIYGVPKPSHQMVMRRDNATGSFLCFYLEGDRLVAALGGNAARDLRFAKRLIEKQTPVRAEDLADPDQPLARL